MQLFGLEAQTIKAGDITLQKVYDAPNNINETIIYKISYNLRGG
jgi:hypothetical protein